MKLHIISTGGTFDKVYNESNGLFDIDRTALAVREIVGLARGNIECKFDEIIHKDSNFFTDEDRALLVQTISQSVHRDIVIVHGTDTMSVSGGYLLEQLPNLQKRVVFVGSMKPYNVQQDEPIFNLAMAIGFLNGEARDGVYVSMHGLVLPLQAIKKDKSAGVFRRIEHFSLASH